MRKQCKQRGATLVEAALTLSVFIILIMGILEFGRASSIRHIVTNAAREGARYSVAPFPGTATLPDNAAVTARVQQFLASGGISASDPNVKVVVTQNYSESINGATTTFTTVEVTVPYTFAYFPLQALTSQGKGLTLYSKAVMRNEN